MYKKNLFFKTIVLRKTPYIDLNLSGDSNTFKTFLKCMNVLTGGL